MYEFLILLLKATIILFVLDYIGNSIYYDNYTIEKILKFLKTLKTCTDRWILKIIECITMALTIIMWVIPKVKQVTTNESDLLLNSYMYGGLLGLLIYIIINVNNHCIIPDYWTLKRSIINILWESFLMGTTTYLIIT